MYVVINQESFFVSYLEAPTSDDLLRPDVIETADRTDLTTAYQYLDGNWIAPPLPPRDPEAAPPRN